MAASRASRRRAAGVASAKVVITTAALAATLGGWAYISATDPQAAAADQPGSTAVAPPTSSGAQPDSGFAPAAPPTQGRRHSRYSAPNSGNLFGNSQSGGDQAAPLSPGTNDTPNLIPSQPRPLARSRSSR
jgi:hypothetical protein